MYTFYFITYLSSLYKQRIYCKKKKKTIFEERLTQTKAYNKKMIYGNMHTLSTQSEPDLKSTFLATITKTQCYTTRTHPDNLGICVSPVLESEGLKKGMRFFFSLAKGIKLQNFNNSL